MIRKFTYNKIVRTTGMLIIFILLLLFPMSKEYKLEDEVTSKTMSNTIQKKEFYLLDSNGYVSRTNISIGYSNSVDAAKKIIEILIIDGKYEDKIPNGFKALLPPDTVLNNVSINNNDITIDVSNDIYELDDNNFKKALELITYNLTVIDNIYNVYLKVDNKLVNKYPNSNKVVNEPLRRSDGVNEIYNESEYKNVSKTTIYFVSKNNNNKYYYVPVTKIDNDSRDKIKIIIDELTTKHIYDTNLMSFLNYNTKLNDYKIENDELLVNFNNYLFDDINNKTILEEVIYSISLSIRDNYDVKNVIFLVDGKEITKSVLKDIE